ncbi:VWA domain-containing protein [bacterium]|nr:VWA domain-containing protein [bacterium]
MIRFAQPMMLLLLLLLPLAGLWLWKRRRRGLRPRMQFSSLMLMGLIHHSVRSRLLGLPTLLLLAAAALMILAMARPQSAWREHQRYTEGIDIMLVIDVSESMTAKDFQPNRLEKAKEVVKSFIDGRKDDQIGIVIFAAETFTLCPLTHDYAALRQFVDFIRFDIINGNATGIGMGLANAVDRLQKSKAKSKVAILLTDGENNTGKIGPITAAQIAQKLGVRVYTIGVGSPGGVVPMDVQTPFGMQTQMVPSQLNVEELTNVAKMTGGQFFLATDGDSLEKIYKQIDRMERTKIETGAMQYYDELAQYLMFPALALLLLAFVLEHTWLRTFP